jgi:signal transduction histidine kinase
LYYNDGHSIKKLHRDYKYLATDSLCGNMMHNKVLLIPEKLDSFITHDPNTLPFPAEAYLAIPLFSQGKCFAHLGMMWSPEGLRKRDVSWGYLELILRSLEDLVLQRILPTGDDSAKRDQESQQSQEKPPLIKIQDAKIGAGQSLKPYARTLSHELRTPMQGIVGMLDVMHATVQEAIENRSNPKVRTLFRDLRENIEVVQGWC